MIVGGVTMYRSRAPIPANGGRSRRPDAVHGGGHSGGAGPLPQARPHGLRFGTGARRLPGPDYTAEALHWMTEAMRERKAPGYASLGTGQKAAVDAEIAEELKVNRYRDGVLRFTADPGRGVGLHRRALHARIRRRAAGPRAAQRRAAAGGRRRRRGRSMTPQPPASWRPSSPGRRGSPSPNGPTPSHSYTNNWPYDKAAGNTATAGSMMWSAVSVATLLMFLALILYVQHRYRLTPEDARGRAAQLRSRPASGSRLRSAPRPSTSWWPSCCSSSSPCWAARWRTTTSTAPPSSASTSCP